MNEDVIRVQSAKYINNSADWLLTEVYKKIIKSNCKNNETR